MDALTYIRAEMRRHADEAKLAIDAAEKAGRDLTDQDRANVRNHTDAIADLRAKEARLLKDAEMRKAVDETVGELVSPAAGVAAPAPAPRTIGEAFVASPQYKSLIASGNIGAGEFSFRVGGEDGLAVKEWGTKANETVESAGTPAESYVPGIQLLLDATADAQRVTLMNVLPKAQTSSNFVRYIAETTSTNSAASVAQLGAMAQSVLVHADTSVEVEKVGTVLYVSDEMLADGPAIRSYLDSRLAQFVEFEEEDQVINGDGSTPNLDGFLQQVTQTQALGADSYADCIFKATTDVRTGGYVEPTHLLIHPTDWQSLRLQKDASDRYLMEMGPYGAAGAYAPSPWGLTPLVTSRIAQGTAMVGAFDNPIACQVFRRGGITVDASNSHASLFAAGQVTIRAQSRLALVIYRIGAFSEITGL